MIKATQEKAKFVPITITLESKVEAEALWAAVRTYEQLSIRPDYLQVLIKISDWFSQEASL